jgi:hypothetical protein
VNSHTNIERTLLLPPTSSTLAPPLRFPPSCSTSGRGKSSAGLPYRACGTELPDASRPPSWFPFFELTISDHPELEKPGGLGTPQRL